MKLAYYIKKNRLKGDARVEALLERLRAAGHVLYAVEQPDAFQPETDSEPQAKIRCEVFNPGGFEPL